MRFLNPLGLGDLICKMGTRATSTAQGRCGVESHLSYVCIYLCHLERPLACRRHRSDGAGPGIFLNFSMAQAFFWHAESKDAYMGNVPWKREAVYCSGGV